MNAAFPAQAVVALAPLAALSGYASALRSLTAGDATFVAAYAHHAPVTRRPGAG